MSPPEQEMVEPTLAGLRLAVEWDIPIWVADQIVRGTLRGKDVEVRGRGHGLVRGSGFGDTGLRIITGEIGATLNPGSLISWEFSDVGMDWHGLLKHGRKLVPPEWEYRVSAIIEKARHEDAGPKSKTAHTRRSRQHGPKRDSVGYSQADRALYSEMERLIPVHGSARAAALILVDQGKVLGRGSPENKAKRLAGRYLRSRRRRNSLKLSETR
jgi:hypothetical protein